MFDFLMGYVMGERTAARAATMARAAAGASAGAVAGEFHDVNERVDRLILVVDAMWSLLKESGWTDEQLKARILEIDSEDGVVDGRLTPQRHRCTKCDSMVEPGRSTCTYCGADLAAPQSGPTDGI
ncbi:MAG: hypothetical protein OEX04_04360 [Acidimicrobiia bacterium]|nr:hypothetical protein [Acidimicrobiia bacterium]MDH5292562.1 hypothetical protein [Acidimicrobiia bacterium]